MGMTHSYQTQLMEQMMLLGNLGGDALTKASANLADEKAAHARTHQQLKRFTDELEAERFAKSQLAASNERLRSDLNATKTSLELGLSRIL